MVLSFSVKGNKLVRKDMKGLVAYTRNNAFAGFDFDREWADVSPVTAQFYKNEECCYDVFIENGMCEIPWEVLEGEGTLKVTVMGGDLIITNSVEIKVYESGLVGGLVPTKASPGVYGYIVEMAEEMEEKYGDTEGIIKDSEAFKGLQGEVDSIESCVEEVKGDVAENKGAVEEISKRVDGVEADVEGKADKEHRHSDAEELIKEMYVSSYDGSEYQLKMLTQLSGGVTRDPGKAYARFYECGNGDVYLYGRFDASEANLSSNVRNVYCLPGSYLENGGFYSDDIVKAYCADSTEFTTYGFSGCTALESVRLPSDMEVIDMSMFEGCVSLKEIEIPEAVREILDYAFAQCTSLAEIKIPKAVTSIYYNAFEGCENLERIIIDKAEGSIADEESNNWGAPNAEVIWLG